MNKAVETGIPAYKKFFSVVSSEVVPVKWLLKGVMEQNSINSVFGPSGEKKSFVVIDMALHVLNNKDWHGHKVKQSDITVLYIAGEGAAGINLRVNAACKHHNLSSDGFYVSNSSADMFDNTVVDGLVEMVKSINGPVWIILDTLNRNFSGEENSTKDIAALLKNIEKLKNATKYGATFTMVHHTGHTAKDRGRGSSAIYAAMDGEFRVSTDKDSGQTTVTNTKNKNSATNDSVILESVSIDFGFDEDGDSITSLAMIGASKKKSASLEEVTAQIAELLKQSPLTQNEIDGIISDKMEVSTITAKNKKKPLIRDILIRDHNMNIVNKQWTIKLS